MHSLQIEDPFAKRVQWEQMAPLILFLSKELCKVVLHSMNKWLQNLAEDKGVHSLTNALNLTF